MTPQQFSKKWKASTLKESSASQEHFIDLCRLIGEQTPAEADPDGTWYCFERGAKKTGGGDGWADVWRRGYFAWEYKGKHKDLTAAFAQLQRYAIALENPPLLVVSDMDTILIHTNFTNTVQEIHAIPLDEVGTPENLQKLKWLFSDSEKLRPGKTTAAITEEAARKFASLAEVLRARGSEPQQVAHFLNRLLFCLFAEDARLLPPQLVVRLLEAGLKHPEQANNMLRALFAAMTKGGLFGADLIEWFNGGLFDSDEAIALEPNDIKEILSVARLDWSSIEPSVFGTLFERGLDPSKRAQLGAHYTDAQSIMRIVDPVVVEPLAAKWSEARAKIEATLAKAEKAKDAGAKTKATNEAQALLNAFLHLLAEFRVLDPACGSGNFLYLALLALKDLEHRASLEAELLGLPRGFTGMNVGVQCVRGIELNTYAAELARVTVWIGEIQWMLRHGVTPSKNPILKPLDTIECRDAVMNQDGTEASWPKVDAIVGNPPFLGDKKMMRELGKDYVAKLRTLYDGRVSGGADLVTYWFEKARAEVETGRASAAGLVATNSIRGGASRKVLERIRDKLAIYDAWSDEAWVNEGAAVRVSLVCFRHQSGSPSPAHALHLNGQPASDIHADLTGSTASGSADLTRARALKENLGVAFSGITKKGSFDLTGDAARAMLKSGGNPNGKPNADVLFPWKNGAAVTDRDPDNWIIHFAERSEVDAAGYEAPFEHVQKHVYPERSKSNAPAERKSWWLLARRAPDFFEAVKGKKRFIATPEVSKHRVFVWLPTGVVPDKNLVAIARDDDVSLGVLSSRFHAAWALTLGTSLEDRPRYTSSTTFRTFPFPLGLAPTTAPTAYKNKYSAGIASAAKKLSDLRANWLNPPEWTETVKEAVGGYPPKIAAKPGREAELKQRTVTALYNAKPAWLIAAHTELNAAVAAAYGWADYTEGMANGEILSRLLTLNLERTAAAAPKMTAVY